jgi:hypothetical protein
MSRLLEGFAEIAYEADLIKPDATLDTSNAAGNVLDLAFALLIESGEINADDHTSSEAWKDAVKEYAEEQGDDTEWED